MKLLPTISLAAALAVATAAFGVDIQLTSSPRAIPLPEEDGSFSNVSSEGHPVRHIYYIISEEEYAAYTSAASPAAAVYEAFLSGEIGEVCLTNAIETTGSSNIHLDDFFWYYDDANDQDVYYDAYFGNSTNACFAAIYTYENAETGYSYYIARPLLITTPTSAELDANPFLSVRITEIATNAGRWEVIAPPSLDIRCTSLSVAGGMVRATYEVSEYSRIMRDLVVDFMLSDTNIYVVASADLSSNVVTNIPAKVGGIWDTTGGAGALSLTFPCPPNFPTLFLRGLEKPQP